MARTNTVDSLDDLLAELGWLSYSQFGIERWDGLQLSNASDYIAEEVPVVLVYNNQPHVVMLTTPLDLEDFALGFSITENIVSNPGEVKSIRTVQRSKGIEIRIQIPDANFEKLHKFDRNLTGRTGCGLCGTKTLEKAMRKMSPVKQGLTVDAKALIKALNSMHELQFLNQVTGSVHGAAWFSPDHGVTCLREDLGRHNALDKLIGSLLKSKTNFEGGCLLVTSRASYEMVQKAVSVGITIMAAISAPTALAVRLADENGLTLLGFVRKERHVIYTHPHRVQYSSELA